MWVAGMVPYQEIDKNAPFSVALGQYYKAAGIIVSMGACAGTFNSAFADLYAMSRLMVVMSRCRLIPNGLVSPQYSNVTIEFCVIQGMVSIATKANADCCGISIQGCCNGGC